MQAAAAHALREWYNTTSMIPTGYNSRRDLWLTGHLAEHILHLVILFSSVIVMFSGGAPFPRHDITTILFFRAPPLWWSPTFLIALLFLAPVMDMAGRQMRQRHDAKTRSGLFWGWDVLQVYTFCNIAFGLLARPGIRSEEGV